MRVVHDGQRFCFQYAFDGAEQNVAPVLRVHRGERFAVRLVNEISGPAPGASIQASKLAPCMPAAMEAVPTQHLSGYLNHIIYASRMPAMKPLDVNLHFHGFEGPAEQENVFISTLSTPARACEYDLTIPRTQPPGTYFYHPHAHGMAGLEVVGGLLGMWIVEPDTPQIRRANEREIIITPRFPGQSETPAGDKKVADNAAITGPLAAERERRLKPVPALTNYDPFDPPLWPYSFFLGTGNDRPGISPTCGPFFAVNGINAPARLSVPAGRTQLLRVLNGTAMQVFQLQLRDAAGKVQTSLHVVGRDGIPVGADAAHPLASYVAMPRLLLGPGSRADVLLTMHAGQTLTLYNNRLCQGPNGSIVRTHDLLTISARAPVGHDVPAAIASRPLIRNDSPAVALVKYARAHSALVRRRALTYTAYFLPDPNGNGTYGQGYITETSNRNFHEHPYWPTFAAGKNTPAQADIVVKRGTIEEWYLFNTDLGAHTFHIHQMAFAGEDEKPLPAMLDNVVVPAGTALPNRGDPAYPFIKPGRTRIILDFRHVPRGEFVFHCHMLFHEDGGMMGVIRVI